MVHRDFDRRRVCRRGLSRRWLSESNDTAPVGAQPYDAARRSMFAAIGQVDMRMEREKEAVNVQISSRRLFGLRVPVQRLDRIGEYVGFDSDALNDIA